MIALKVLRWDTHLIKWIYTALLGAQMMTVKLLKAQDVLPKRLSSAESLR
jgi:NAD dependent epimerase/dehydratase family enzyme